jgi:hypothetical protein
MDWLAFITNIANRIPIERVLFPPRDKTKALEEFVTTMTAPVVKDKDPLEQKMTATTTKEPEASPKEETIATACVPCMPPTALILTNPDVKEIMGILVGDKVLDARGNYSTVTKVWERPYDGELISITVPYQSEPIQITPEHPVLAIKAKHCSKLNQICFPGKDNPHCQNCLGKKYSPEFIPAKDLITSGASNHRIKHILLAPRLKSIKDIHEIKASEVAGIGFEDIGNGWIKPRKENAHNRGPSAVAVKDRIVVNGDFMALAGFYLSEGSGDERGGHTRFDFGKEEGNYALEVKQLLVDVFGVEATISPNTESTLRVLASSRLVAAFFVNLFGKGALTKRIPQWMLTLPHAKQQILVEKYWRGDGSQWINAEETQNMLSASTVSRSLAYSLRLILHRLYIIHSIGKYKVNNSVINGRLIKSNGYNYQIQVWGPAAAKLAKMINFSIPKNWHFLQSHQAGIDENWIYLPIKKIERNPYKGMVMNLTTEPDNTYSVEGVAVHNCAVGHFSTSAGLLKEAVRFKGEGITSNEILNRVAMALEEQNALERGDLTPEKIQNSPPWEKELAEEALLLSRKLRHNLENLQTIEQLQQLGADSERVYKKLFRGWFKQRFAHLGPGKSQRIADEVGKLSPEDKERVLARAEELIKEV